MEFHHYVAGKRLSSRASHSLLRDQHEVGSAADAMDSKEATFPFRGGGGQPKTLYLEGIVNQFVAGTTILNDFRKALNPSRHADPDDLI